MAWHPAIFFGENVCVCGSQQRPERLFARGLWLLICQHCQNFILDERKLPR